MEQLVVEQGAILPDLNAHGTEEQLELYALGRLPGSGQVRLEEHLLVCAACRDKLNEIGDFALAMRAAGKQLMADSRRASAARGKRGRAIFPVV